MAKSLARKKKGHAPDYVIVFCLAFLVLFGLLMLSSASSTIGQERFGDSLFYLKNQLMLGVGFGVLGFLLTFKTYYGVYKKKWISTTALLLSIILLLAVFTPLGSTQGGATRWLNIGGFSFQPAELLKLSLVIYFAIWLSNRKERQEGFREGYLPFLTVLGLVSGLLFLQRSTTPAVILALVALIMYFISGAKWRYIFLTVGLGLVVLASVIVVTPYRLERFKGFLNQEGDPLGSSYHIRQAKTAIGAGGLLGAGYGQSVVKSRLPEPIGDSIFAVIGEEFGFVGTTVLQGVFAVLVLRMFLLARKARDKFAQLLLVGFGSLIGIQAFVNIAAMSGLIPLTGTPLPFISFGGTALAIFITMGGIVTNVSKYT